MISSAWKRPWKETSRKLHPDILPAALMGWTSCFILIDIEMPLEVTDTPSSHRNSQYAEALYIWRKQPYLGILDFLCSWRILCREGMLVVSFHPVLTKKASLPQTPFSGLAGTVESRGNGTCLQPTFDCCQYIFLKLNRFPRTVRTL